MRHKKRARQDLSCPFFVVSVFCCVGFFVAVDAPRRVPTSGGNKYSRRLFGGDVVDYAVEAMCFGDNVNDF